MSALGLLAALVLVACDDDQARQRAPDLAAPRHAALAPVHASTSSQGSDGPRRAEAPRVTPAPASAEVFEALQAWLVDFVAVASAHARAGECQALAEKVRAGLSGGTGASVRQTLAAFDALPQDAPTRHALLLPGLAKALSDALAPCPAAYRLSLEALQPALVAFPDEAVALSAAGSVLAEAAAIALVAERCSDFTGVMRPLRPQIERLPSLFARVGNDLPAVLRAERQRLRTALEVIETELTRLGCGEELASFMASVSSIAAAD